MHYFIDESGIFSNPGNKVHAISSIAILGIPSGAYRSVVREYRTLRSSWPPAAEHKGKSLSEPQIAATLGILAGVGCIAWVGLTDMGICSEGEAIRARRLQAKSVLFNFEKLQHHTMRAQVMALAKTFLRMSTQQFIQHLLTMDLMDQALRESLIHLGVYRPDELSRLRWTFDQRHISAMETKSFIEHTVCGHLQSSAATEPLVYVREGDYSAMASAHKTDTAPPDHLREHLAKYQGGPFQYTDIGMLFRGNLRFADSARCTGLQLADVCASAIARAARGNLQRDGWERLGSLLLRNPDGTVRVGEVAPSDLSRPTPSIHRAPYAGVLVQLHGLARPLLR